MNSPLTPSRTSEYARIRESTAACACLTALSNLSLTSRCTLFAVQYAAAADRTMPSASTANAVEAWLAISTNFGRMPGPGTTGLLSEFAGMLTSERDVFHQASLPSPGPACMVSWRLVFIGPGRALKRSLKSRLNPMLAVQSHQLRMAIPSTSKYALRQGHGA